MFESSIIIFRIVQKIHRNLPEKILSLKEYPNLDMGGKENIKINPALELIKAIYKVTILPLYNYQVIFKMAIRFDIEDFYLFLKISGFIFG